MSNSSQLTAAAPLLEASGLVVGVNAVKRVGGDQGVHARGQGIAIPIALALRESPQLRPGGGPTGNETLTLLVDLAPLRRSGAPGIITPARAPKGAGAAWAPIGAQA